MSPYRLALCLLTIGWSERELVRRSGEHRNTVRRWLAGESAIDGEVAAWLEILTAVHRANPGPRRSKRARASTRRKTPAPRSRRTQIETVRELERRD